MTESTLLSIKEFSEFTGVPQSTLRYYDEIGLLPAAFRGENNYRYYTPFQVIKLNYINVLTDIGVTLSSIKDIDEHRTPEIVIDLLRRQEEKLDNRLNELRSAYTIIHTYLRNIQTGAEVEDGLIRIEELEEFHYVLGGKNEFKTSNDTFYEEFIRFCQSADKLRINLRYPVGGYHEDHSSFFKIPNQPTRYFSADPLGNCVRPAGKYLVAYNRGYYGNFGDIPKKMTDYAAEHELVLKGPLYVVFILDEISMPDPGEFMSRIVVGTSPKKRGRPHK